SSIEYKPTTEFSIYENDTQMSDIFDSNEIIQAGKILDNIQMFDGKITTSKNYNVDIDSKINGIPQTSFDKTAFIPKFSSKLSTNESIDEVNSPFKSNKAERNSENPSLNSGKSFNINRNKF